jgi:hypothetical protein
MSFDCVIDKIRTTPIERAPFDHLYIQDFFEPHHFSQITATPQIDLQSV